MTLDALHRRPRLLEGRAAFGVVSGPLLAQRLPRLVLALPEVSAFAHEAVPGLHHGAGMIVTDLINLRRDFLADLQADFRALAIVLFQHDRTALLGR